MHTVGIDIGSVTAKGALMSGEVLLAATACFTGYNAGAPAHTIYEQLLADHHVSPEDIRGVVATGYGRASVPFATRTFTEIMCHAAGARHLNPAVRAVIDIGGQDSKAIMLV